MLFFQVLASALLLALSPTLTLSTQALPLRRLRVTLVRHGESENNVLHEVSYDHYAENRFADPPLTKLGIDQCEALKSYFSSLRGEDGTCYSPLIKSITKVYASPFMRTLQTAKAVGEGIGVDVRIWRGIHEVGGCYDKEDGIGGFTKEDILRDYGFSVAQDVGDNWEEGGAWYKRGGRETREQALERIGKVVEVLRGKAKSCEDEGKDESILLVCHGDFIDYFLSTLFRLPSAGDQTKSVFRCYNCSMSCLDIFSDGKVALLFHNDVEYLGRHVKKEKLGIV